MLKELKDAKKRLQRSCKALLASQVKFSTASDERRRLCQTRKVLENQIVKLDSEIRKLKGTKK